MNDNARRQSVKTYFEGIAAKDMSRVPWAKDATLRTPLNPAGGESVLIRGRQAILDFFNGILPAVRSLKLLHHYTGDGGWVAGQAEISLANGKTLYVLDAFRVEKRRDYRAAEPLRSAPRDRLRPLTRVECAWSRLPFTPE